MSSRERFQVALLSVALLVIALVGVTVLTFRSSWFANLLRTRVIAAIENTTGARADVGKLTLEWRTFKVRLERVTLHGSEPFGASPLFHADTIEVGLTASSLLSREVRLDSLIIERPGIHIISYPDGKTNFASILRHRAELERQALSFRISDFDLVRGSLLLNATRLHVGFNIHQLTASLNYIPLDRHNPTYLIAVSSPAAKLEITGRQVNSAIEVRARFKGNLLSLDSARVATSASYITGNGALQISSPASVQMRLDASVDASDIAPFCPNLKLRSGRLLFDGTLARASDHPLRLEGPIHGRNISLDKHESELRGIDFSARLSVSLQNFALNGFALSSPDLSASGRMAISGWRVADFAGKVSAGLGPALRILSNAELPYSGHVESLVSATWLLDEPARDLTVSADTVITPAPGRMPMSGHVTGTYDGRSRSLTFGESQLTLLHSQLCLSGRVGDNVHVEVQSSDTSELQPIFKVFQPGIVVRLFDVTNAQIAFTGEVRGGGSAVSIGGDLGLRNFEAIHRHWDSLQSNVSASNEAIAFRNLRLQQGPVEIIGNVSTGLSDWTINRDSPLSAQVRISGQRIAGLLSQLFFGQIDVTGGDGTAAVNLRGTTERLSGSGQVSLAHVRVFNQPVDALRIPVRLQDGTLQIEAGHVRTGGANATFSFNYQPMNQSFHSGDLSISLDTNQFALSSLGEIAQRLPDVRARAELHGQAHVAVSPGGVKLLAASGTATLRRIEFPGVHGGELSLDIASREGFAVAGVAGNLEGTRVGGNARVALNEGNYTTGALQFGAVQLGPLIGMLYPSLPQRLNGVAAGEVTFAGPLQSPALGKASVRLSELEIVIPKQGDTVIRSLEPVAVEIEHGTANIRRMRMGTTGTELHLSGAVGLEGRHAVDIRADGGLNLQSLETFDENIRCTGSAHVTASISGTLERPSLAGDMQLRDASAFFKNIGMGFTDAAGTVRFNRNHAVLERLTAQSGGGNLFVSGSILFGGGTPLSYNLSATASNIRTRYLGASITGNAALRLAGTSVNGVLAGNVQLSRVVFDPQADATALLASAIASPPAALNQQDFTAGIALDVEVQSTPDLEIVSTLSTNLQARVDLRLRGTRARPVLSGHISTQEGDLKIFGAKYTINRGEITFSNTARIEPVLDLDLQTETRGITVDIVVTGTPSKLNMNYRSDPPLQPKDIIALLTVGQAPTFGNVTNGAQIGPDVSALQAGASSVLSGALSSRSGGLTRLFGVTNIKIDPLAQGLTNTPQARLTLEQQISKNVSVIYVTNLAQTSEQIFRFEWALNPQYSVVAVRDDNGEFGIDIQFKKRFK